MQGISANRSYGGNTINVSKDPMAKLSYEMYEVVKEFLEGIIHLNWQGPNSKLAVIGGIMVNCDDDGTDMFVPLMFGVLVILILQRDLSYWSMDGKIVHQS